ncbi:hypothetical protein RRG08_031505 [Elysia crispata]|uniref:Uncharacterized protein n=1 Tax=Elysia crispata TaxID=231223 RepID=A0AAE1CPX5_9GAST|nr:hypothetical protein RRG08_031505 [Elysia crispata]
MNTKTENNLDKMKLERMADQLGRHRSWSPARRVFSFENHCADTTRDEYSRLRTTVPIGPEMSILARGRP